MISAEPFTVLVVNDEPLLHRILHTSLRSCGFAVEEGRTAEEALEVMKKPAQPSGLQTNAPTF
jgi:CheY-like chemotaxis protein